MSIRVMTRVWADSKQEGGTLLVLLAMADNADDDGFCFPSQPYLAKKARLSERQVRRVIDTLISDGEITIARQPAGRGKRTIYKIFPKPGQDVRLSELKKEDICDTKRRTFATPSIIKEPSVQPSRPPNPLKGASVSSKLKVGKPTDPTAIRVAACIGRQPTTEWTAEEIRLFKTVAKRSDFDSELEMIAAYYAANRKKPDNICRTTVERLLKHWPGEVDRARSWAEKRAPKRKAEPKVAARSVLDDVIVDKGPDLPPADPVAAKAFCEQFEKRMGRLPGGYERKGEDIVFIGNSNGTGKRP